MPESHLNGSLGPHRPWFLHREREKGKANSKWGLRMTTTASSGSIWWLGYDGELAHMLGDNGGREHSTGRFPTFVRSSTDGSLRWRNNGGTDRAAVVLARVFEWQHGWFVCKVVVLRLGWLVEGCRGSAYITPVLRYRWKVRDRA